MSTGPKTIARSRSAAPTILKIHTDRGLFLLAAGAGQVDGLGPGSAGEDGRDRAKDGHAGRHERGGTEAVVEADRGAEVPVGDEHGRGHGHRYDPAKALEHVEHP